MADWISIEEGTYMVEQAFLLTPGYDAMSLEDAVIDVYVDGNGERRVRGDALAAGALIIALLEDYDEIDLLLDLGDGFTYLLEAPTLRAGKAIAPGVKSLLHFIAQSPLKRLTYGEYSDLRSRLSLLDGSERE